MKMKIIVGCTIGAVTLVGAGYLWFKKRNNRKTAIKVPYPGEEAMQKNDKTYDEIIKQYKKDGLDIPGDDDRELFEMSRQETKRDTSVKIKEPVANDDPYDYGSIVMVDKYTYEQMKEKETAHTENMYYDVVNDVYSVDDPHTGGRIVIDQSEYFQQNLSGFDIYKYADIERLYEYPEKIYLGNDKLNKYVEIEILY